MRRLRVAFVLGFSVAAVVLVTDCSDATRYLVCSTRNANFSPQSVRNQNDCRNCLETNCCLELGVCQPQELPTFAQEDTDAAAPCLANASRLFECTSAAGSVDNNECRSKLGIAAGGNEEKLLACASRRCPACGVPAPCQLDPSVPAIVNGQCDSCVSARCCHKVQACYADRKCKLAFECIVSAKNHGCVDEIIGAVGALPRGTLGALAATACKEGAAPAVLPAEVPRCVRDCVDAFDPNRCLALDLVACLDSSGCIAACGTVQAEVDGSAPADAGIDAPPDAGAADAPSD